MGQEKEKKNMKNIIRFTLLCLLGALQTHIEKFEGKNNAVLGEKNQ